MPLLRSALLRRWLSVAPDCPVLEASRRIAQREPGIPATLWVEQDKQLLGCLSALDLLEALHQKIPSQTPIRELSWADPVSISAPTSPEFGQIQELSFLLNAARHLAQPQREALPVLDAEGYPKGILTPLSLLQALKPLKLFQINAVGSWVQPLPLQAPTDLPLGSLLPLLVQHRAESALLRDPQRNTPAGWIPAEQLLSLTQENPNWHTLPAQAASLPCGVPLHAAESLAVAYNRMRQEASADLLVVNSHAQVLGWLRPHHLLHLLLPEQLFLSHRSAEVAEDLPGEFLQRPGARAIEQNLDPEVASLDRFKRRWAEEALRKSESLRHAILAHIPAVIWLVDRDLRYTYFSGAILQQFGIDPQAALGRTLTEVHGESAEGLHTRHHRLALEGIPCAYEAQVAGVTYECRVDLLPNHEGVIGIAVDISERKEAEARLERLAHYDPLTQLPNRTLFQRRLQEFLQQPDPLAVLFLDLDDFKTINDSLGHSAGDRVLQLIAKRLQEQVPAGDLIARMGGDEFTFILTHLENRKQALTLAQSLLDTFAQPIQLDNHELYVSGSIGISFYPQDASDLDSLVQYADAAMYRAKAQSRNSYQVHHSDPQPKALGRLTLESRLRRAIEQEQLQVLYQPQWDIDGQNIVGAEALVRWDLSEQESISPEQFIPLAEETGLILPLGEWVLRQSCTQAQNWRAQGWPNIKVAVNLSMRQFQQQDMVARLKAILAETQLPAAALELEITETTAAGNFEQTLEILHRLYQLGVRLAIDDFGTGYSSINYLKRFPLHKLKIDQSFIRDLNTTMVPLSRYEKSDIAVVAAIIDLGHSLNLRVAAEGVETLSQLDILQNLKCDEVQGFLLGRPVSAVDFLQQLREHT
jgi:diguanylate cyclase (GGDEF)-like protein/PAS domain S-box-containing protein